MERKEPPLRPDDRDFDGVVARFEEGGGGDWIRPVTDFLRDRHRVDAVGFAALLAIGCESFGIDSPSALIVVASVTAALAVFVILIGRPHGNEIAAGVTDDAGTAAQGTGEIGAS